MIIVKLWGGLGNQMFQYAFGYSLAKAKNDKCFFETSFYQNQPNYVSKRSIEIDRYFSLSSFETIERPKEVFFLENKYINKAIRAFPGFRCHAGGNFFFVKEHTRTFMEAIPYKEGKCNYYDGYWLSNLYFDKYQDDIRREFTFKKSIREQICSGIVEDPGSSVAVHIRRGDYLNEKHLPGGHDEKSLYDFYMRAICYMKDRLGEPRFYIYSDDIEWCKTAFVSVDGVAYPENSGQYAALKDFTGIESCKHGILSFSTFSWWANWLRKEPGIVVAPKGDSVNTQFIKADWVRV